MAITTVEEIKFTAGLTNEFSDEEIETEIDLVEAELYQRYFLPKRYQFSVNNDYENFYIYPYNVHEIIRVQGSVDSTVDPSGYQTIATGSYSFTTPNNYITLTTATINQYDNKLIRVQHIPKTINQLATNMVSLNLLDTTTVVDGEENIPPLITRIKDKIMRYKSLLKPRTIIKSSDNINFNENDYLSLTQGDYR